MIIYCLKSDTDNVKYCMEICTFSYKINTYMISENTKQYQYKIDASPITIEMLQKFVMQIL